MLLAVKWMVAKNAINNINAIMFMNLLPPDLFFQRLAIAKIKRQRKGMMQRAIARPVSVIGLVDVIAMRISIPAIGKC